VRRWLGPIETCTCKALMRARWTRDRWPQAYVCTRCGRPVPGYERLWWEMERELERLRKGNPSNASKF